MKIAIVVQGRFHAFDLARVLIDRGHDVTVFTNYPQRIAARYGLPVTAIRSYLGHFVADRAVGAASWSALSKNWEPVGHQAFGRWAARQLALGTWDVIHCWSGVSEELLAAAIADRTPTLLMRGSSHIAFQRQILDEESARVGAAIDRPSDWMIAREQREYERASRIVVLSTFAAETFSANGIPPERLSMLPLGADLSAFRAPERVRRERIERVRSGEPLSVAYAGSVSFRKGFWDLAAIVRALPADRFRFTIAGSVLPECRPLLESLGSRIEALGPIPQSQLPEFYQRADLFVFPTIEDGFGLVLAQARAAGLPLLATTNCAARDCIRDGDGGWILPIRQPQAFVDRLLWCDRDREALANMMRASTAAQPADWRAVGEQFDELCTEVAAQLVH